ncbi:MAG: YggS family pyridoxal phosphate-dependent enzyme [Tissierellales bacterium]|nr:YggS family pyridoxal phosphate-dependent enzyme [Tissierellales bacterium]MBN2827676.1 YggS family pyridoxal phosphate-dependent enzyme [Tissierellales bacterium]
MLSENIEKLLKSIEETCYACDRKPNSVMLVAVTKTVDPDRISEAVSYGLTELGENKVQELTSKYPLLPNFIKWHMIGHLQRNKVKYIIDKVKLIQSVDSLKLAEEIDRQSKKNSLKMDILIEVNIGEEESKFGIKPEEALEFALSLQAFQNIRLRGLMTVAPFFEDSERVRPYMKKMQTLFKDLQGMALPQQSIDILSMGMSNDYRIAIEEGSTMIRVGSIIFGERHY